MSAILSAEDLNDFVKPGIACIKPVETLPAAPEPSYEVTTEDAAAAANPPPATITLSDCLACSGCVTSAETVLISLQSHTEVLNALDSAPSVPIAALAGSESSHANGTPRDAKVFVASLSPQIRASLAATYGVSERQAGFMAEQLLCGPDGLSRGSKHGARFAWVVDTNAMREVCLAKEAEAAAAAEKRPLLASACPGWICYVEKERPEALPHLSPLKSPQALTGTLLKSVLATRLGLHPSRIWHVAVMPCFDKKLEASRRELTDEKWVSSGLAALAQDGKASDPVRDVDCVITPRELLALAEARGIDFAALPKRPLAAEHRAPFPDPEISAFLFPKRSRRNLAGGPDQPGAGTSGGYLQHVLATQAALHPGSTVRSRQGRKVRGVYEVAWEVCVPDDAAAANRVVFRAKRVYGFENIVNLTKKIRQAAGTGPLKPRLSRAPAPEEPFDYVEVMACPGGCTNGGGQIRLDELPELKGRAKPTEDKKEWLKFVDEAYFSMSDDDDVQTHGIDTGDEVNGISPARMNAFVRHWEDATNVPAAKLLYTTFKEVKSDVGKKATKTERAAALAIAGGGGW